LAQQSAPCGPTGLLPCRQAALRKPSLGLIGVRGGRTGSFCADEGARVSEAVEPAETNFCAKMRPSARRLKLIRAKIKAVSLMTLFRSDMKDLV
jgi:hypothetical protein